MKKKSILILSIVASVMLSGCCLSHSWKDADCTSPQTCTECGKTAGEPLGHVWVDADCVNPKTCERCGETEGNALGHKWTEANCTSPKTCSVCKETEGEALGHDFAPPTLQQASTCTRCNATQGSPITFVERNFDYSGNYDKVYLYKENALGITKSKRSLKLDFIDVNGETVNSAEVNLGRHNWSYSTLCNDKYSVCTSIGLSDSKDSITIYDWTGKVAADFEITFDDNAPAYITCRLNPEGKLLLIYAQDSSELVKTINIESGEELVAADYSFEEQKDLPADYRYAEYCKATDGYIVYDETVGEWLYLDKEGIKLCSYKDATAFTENGYAFVSEEEGKYSLIDKDFNVIEKNCIEADTVSVISNTNIYVMLKGETVEYYSISLD